MAVMRRADAYFNASIKSKSSDSNLFDKTLNELNKLIGLPDLIRQDGKTTTARFDSKNCKLFVFMNSTLKVPLVEYYELRSSIGELIDNKKNIELCFKEIKIG